MKQSQQLISLQLTPMQIPEAVPTASGQQPAANWVKMASTDGTSLKRNLLLRPGEPSEMVVQVKNMGARPLGLNLQVQGDFPQEWCQVGMEGSQVLPGQQMEAVLYFQIAADFFERYTAVGKGERLKLDYDVRLSVHWQEANTGVQHIEEVKFHLNIRPHSLYLNFLPMIYREVDFVGRFLKVFEQSFEPCVHTLDSLWAYLDPLTAPSGMLPFLAQWVAWQPTVQLSEAQQRLLIKKAMEIYRWRGTRRGLRLYLHLATGLPLDEEMGNEVDKHICITESFSRGLVFGQAKLGEDAIIGGGRPFHFTVRLHPEYGSEIDELLVRNVIEQEKPAFCTYELYIEPRSSEYVITSVTNRN
ncbi:phage tail protein [Calothrix sp. 336/3]|uniref:phage tail protein n=1 Tax=Calothrix sp. 336/3 TaxID=1337936 RepID=UPI0006245C64|nr:phage tail protein [Calothrix sp. 336/3]AKG20485.1 phage tail protein [Calothrix sp. 336/3]